MAGLAAAGRARRAGGAADHVRRGRRAPPATSSSSTGYPATRARRRCASATPPAGSSSSTCTARCWPRWPSCAAWPALGIEVDDDDEAWDVRGRCCSSTCEGAWHQPDDGLWEVRGEPPALHGVEGHGLVRLRPVAVRLGRAVRARGPDRPLAGDPRRDPRRGAAPRATTRSWAPSPRPTARRQLDASLLFIPLTGFLPADDERVLGHRRRPRARAAPRRLRCCATAATPPTTGCRPAKACSSPARSGSSTCTCCRAARARPAALFERLAGAGQRRRPVRRGVRPGRQAPARQLPPGVHPPGTGAGRGQPVRTPPAVAGRAPPRPAPVTSP